MEEKLIELIADNYTITGITSQKVNFEYGESIKISEWPRTIQEYVPEVLESDELKEYMKLGERGQVAIIHRCAKKVFHEQQFEEEMPENFDLTNLHIISDLFDDNSENMFWDIEKGEISDLSYTKVSNYITPKQLGRIEKHPCKFLYDPTIPYEENFKEFSYGQSTFKRVNVYKHPEWRIELETSSNFRQLSDTSLPDAAQDFFLHLFPDKKSREYVYDWLYLALTSRNGNEHILLLNGPTGTGKTIFCSNFLRALVGTLNWGTAPKNLFESTFNKVLFNKRIVYIDEARITESGYNTVKLYANKFLNIESKGVDANNTTELFYSMALSNNKVGNVYVDPDDRRFSIVETTKMKLRDGLGADFATDFITMLDDKEFIKQIGAFILSRYDSPDEVDIGQFKGPTFYKFVWRHLSQWQKLVCNKIFKAGENEEDEIDLSELLGQINVNKNIRYDVQPDTVLEFIDNYKFEDEHYLGTTERNEDDEWIIKINPVFIKGAEVVEDLL